MNELSRYRHAVEPARSFDLVADAYDRARPSYPSDAVAALLQGLPESDAAPEVLELGAGTGKLTRSLVERGCSVTATDHSTVMLARLAAARFPGARVLAARAEEIPLASRSADLVVAAQAFHWFDPDRLFPEVARVLRPGGRFAVIWNTRDERIPWVKRLGRIIGSGPGTSDAAADPTRALDETGMFTSVERSTFRFWQPLDRNELRDLVASRSNVATMSELERERVLQRVDDLYAEYGRGADGMVLPYVTTVCTAAILPWALPEPAPEPPRGGRGTGTLPAGGADRSGGFDDGLDDGLLIDFR
jgi:SAM-dependent methyltransferase